MILPALEFKIADVLDLFVEGEYIKSSVIINIKLVQ